MGLAIVCRSRRLPRKQMAGASPVSRANFLDAALERRALTSPADCPGNAGHVATTAPGEAGRALKSAVVKRKSGGVAHLTGISQGEC